MKSMEYIAFIKGKWALNTAFMQHMYVRKSCFEDGARLDHSTHSLQITPACNMPLMSVKNGGKVAIVNLQVIAGVMCMLNLRIPPYIHTDFVQLSLRHSVRKKCVRWILRVTSIHGLRAPLSFLRSIEVSFPERPDMKSVVLKEQPFSFQRETSMNRSFVTLVTLNFSDGCGCSSSSIEWLVGFQKQKRQLR